MFKKPKPIVTTLSWLTGFRELFPVCKKATTTIKTKPLEDKHGAIQKSSPECGKQSQENQEFKVISPYIARSSSAWVMRDSSS